MIADTGFRFEDPALVAEICRHLKPGTVTSSEIAEIRAECEAERAVCLACDDGVIVIALQPYGAALEMFIWLGVALRYGAFERQGPALLALARDLGAQTIAFHARRRGWSRRLGLEWTRRGNDFVRRVDGR